MVSNGQIREAMIRETRTEEDFLEFIQYTLNKDKQKRSGLTGLTPWLAGLFNILCGSNKT